MHLAKPDDIKMCHMAQADQESFAYYRSGISSLNANWFKKNCLLKGIQRLVKDFGILMFQRPKSFVTVSLTNSWKLTPSQMEHVL